MAVVLSSMIAAGLTGAVITSLSVASSTTDQISDTTDAALVSSFLVRDAQAAGATDPTTATRDPSLGVTTDPAAVAWVGCAQPTPFLVRFSWNDRTSAPLAPAALLSASASAATRVVSYYYLDTTNAQLTRRLCKSATTVDVVLARHLTSATATCDTVCTGSPSSVSLALQGSGLRAPWSYTLKASLRNDVQAAPTTANSPPVPLLTLGAGATLPCPNLTLAGTGGTKVIGDVLVDASCGAAPISGNQALLDPNGTTNTIVGIADPFASRVPPAAACTGTNPGTIGVSATRDTVTAYPQTVVIAADAVFQPGRYVFCNGLAINDGSVTGTDVLLYVPTGAVSVGAAATVDLGGRGPGSDASVLLWVATPGVTIPISGGGHVSTLRGVVYAPTSTVVLSSAIAVNVGGIVARDVTVSGTGQARIGLPLARLSVTPTVLPAGQVGLPSTPTTLTASGGIAPYRWCGPGVATSCVVPFTTTGLASGFVIDASTGVLTGTPTSAGTLALTVTVFDATAQAGSFDLVATIAPPLSVVWPASLPDGTVGVAYTAAAPTASGGTTPYGWAATGLPTGLSISASTGTVSGTPATAGSFTVTISVTDARGASQSKTYPLTVTAGSTGCPPTIVGWLGEYFTNPNLQGNDAKLCRDDPAVNFDWGSSSPGGKIPKNNFSVRWTRTQPFAAGTYTFAMGSDAGSRLYVDGVLVLNSWYDQTYPNPQPTVAVFLADGSHTVVMEYYAGKGSNRATLTWAASTPAACAVAPTGWLGQYFSNVSLTSPPAACRDDASITFDWGSGAPMTGLPVDNFSVRWTRTQTYNAGTYTFTLGTDDGGRLYVDGALLINRWVDQGYPTPQPTASKVLSAGSHKVVVEYYERGGSAKATLVVKPTGVTATSAVKQNMRTSGEEDINVTTSSTASPITALTLTIVVAQNPGGASLPTFFTSFVGLTQSTSTAGGFITFTTTLSPGMTIPPGSTGTIAAQFVLNNTPHPTTGDTWTLTTTTALGTATLTGTF